MSISTMRACACGLRTRVAPEHPGGVEVARVGELARDLRDASARRRAVADAAPAQRARRGVLIDPAASVHGVEDLLVAGAAAEVAGERLADLVVLGSGTRREQVGRRDDEARACRSRTARRRRRRTPPARGAARPSAPSPSTVDDLVPVRLRGEHEARADELAVEEHRARAALALLAGVLRAGQPEPLAQRRRAGSRPPRRRPRAARR